MLSQFISPAHLPWTLTVLALIAVALWRGGRQERLAANGLVVGWLLSKLLYRYQGGQTEWGILAVDVGLFALLVWIALRSARHWPLFAAGFQLLGVITHLAISVDTRVHGWAYITASIIWSYLLAFAIGYGAWTAPARAGEPDQAGGLRR